MRMLTKDHCLEVWTDSIDVTPSAERDPEWVYLDSNGHKHRWDDDVGAQTMEWVTLHEATDEMTEIGRYECLLCREPIRPGYRPVVLRQYARGLTHFVVDGKEVTREEFAEKAKDLGLPVGV